MQGNCPAGAEILSVSAVEIEDICVCNKGLLVGP